MMMNLHATAADPHRDWLDQRNRMLVVANCPTATDALTDAAAGDLNEIDQRFLITPARTADGLAAKMLTVLQNKVEGYDVIDETIAAIIQEAQSILDMGSLAGAADDIREGR